MAEAGAKEALTVAGSVLPAVSAVDGDNRQNTTVDRKHYIDWHTAVATRSRCS